MASRNKFVSLALLQLLIAFSVVQSGNGHGLKVGFYEKTCPAAETVVANTSHQFISRTPTLAAPLLRMHFHDCFVRGCDGSILLNSTKNNQAEKAAFPNLRVRGYQVIDAAKSKLEKICPGVVSCADILALVARDAVAMINGPYWDVPTGRRDGSVSRASEALTGLLPPFANITQLKLSFAAKGLSVKDLVVLSGGHTIGTALCSTFTNRLYNFTGKGDADPTLDPRYAANLRKKCKPNDVSSFVELDPGSFETFDEDYYTAVAKKRGLLQSDAALLDDPETKAYAILQASTHGSTFAQDFAESMVKMGNIGVLRGKAGEIRKHCAFVNK